MSGLGLVFAGGGGKGAYQIGVWKALQAYGVVGRISAVSGTSVGALNAALFIQGDITSAENVWLNISKEKMLELKKDQLKDQLVSGFSNIMSYHNLEAAALTSVFFTKKYNDGLFSRKGLIGIMDESLDFSRITYSKVPCYATCLEVPALKVKYFNISGMEESGVKSVLLATSALPIIYEQENIEGKTYIDGGIPNYGDNVPLKPLYDIGIRNFIVVHLSRDNVLDTDLYSDAKILQIVPREQLGDLLQGTLDFSSEGARRRIEQGYNDALNILEQLYQMGMVQNKILDKLMSFQEDNRNFLSLREKTLNQRNELKNNLAKLADAWGKKDYE